MVGTNSELVSFAAASRQFQDAMQQATDPAKRESLTNQRKASEDALEKAIEQASMVDAKHAIAVESDSAVRLAYTKAMRIHLFLAHAVADSEDALDRRVKGAVDSYTTFKGMQKSFRDCLTSLGNAAALVDLTERSAAVLEAAGAIEEIAKKEAEAVKECRLLRLSS